MVLRRFQNGVLAAALVGMILPTHAFSASPAATQQMVDVALASGGTVHGQVANASGQALAHSQVQLLQGQQVVATTVTDQRGQFRVSNLRGGLYGLRTVKGSAIFRAWAPGTAPPHARPGILFVTGDASVLGQGSSALQALTSPGMHLVALGLGITGTTLGVVALTEDDDAS